MENLKISFTTFLKICTRTPLGKIRELQSFTKPGGYDFYKVMKKLVGKLASGEIDLDNALQQIEAIKRSAERKHTREAITKFHDWLIKQDLEWQAPPKGTFKSESGLLTVRLEPELAFKKSGGDKTDVLYLWNLSKPDLKKDLAGEGLQLLVRELRKGGDDPQFAIFNLRNGNILREDSISAASDLRLRYNLLMLESIWIDIHNPELSVEDTISHMSSLKLPPASPTM